MNVKVQAIKKTFLVPAASMNVSLLLVVCISTAGFLCFACFSEAQQLGKFITDDYRNSDHMIVLKGH